MTPGTTATEILNRLDEPFTAELLFDQLPDIVFFIKDAEGRYVCVNRTLVDRCRLEHKSDLIGNLPSEVLGESLGRAYENQDQRVLRTGQPLIEQLELHPVRSRHVGWCMTTKIPLFDADRFIVGLVGVSQDLKLPDIAAEDFLHISDAVQYAERNLSKRPTIVELANIAGMSVYQLDRRMQRVFGLKTGQWVLKSRISRATAILLDTDMSVSEVALEAGYTDQSAFSRQFRRSTGLSPSEYRRLRPSG